MEGPFVETVKMQALDRPPALMIPALASEMDGPAFPRIVEELKEVPYVAEVVLALGKATSSDLLRAKRSLGKLPVKSTVVWPESENLSAVLETARSGVDAGPPGKGRDVWIALGYLLGRGGFHAIGLHDADVVTYTREIPLRLLAPLLNPELGFVFCKGYYPRVSGRSLAGRATRLLVAPLVSVLLKISDSITLNTIGAMRYALSGEFSFTTQLATDIPIPRDWGLEVGILSAVSRTVPSSSICQTDLCDNYDHKHQELHPEDTSRGLNRMAVEVATNLLREVENPEVLTDLPKRYRETAVAMIPSYRADALANGLVYDEKGETAVIDTFTKAVQTAMGLTDKKSMIEPLPAWKAAEKVVPELQKRIVEAVEKDNK